MQQTKAKAFSRTGRFDQVDRDAKSRLGCIALVLLLLPAANAEPEMSVVYRFHAPAVEKGPALEGGKGFHRLHMPGLTGWGAPGQPILPWRLARVLLPPGTTVARIAVEPGMRRRLDGRFHLQPARRDHSPIDGMPPPEASLDAQTFASLEPLPANCWSYHGVGFKHGRAVALLSLCPITYYPRKGEVFYTESINVTLETRSEDATAKGGSAGHRRAKPLNERLLDLQEFVDNFEDWKEAQTAAPSAYGKSREGGSQGGGGGSERIVYAIITTEDLAPAFVPLKEARDQAGFPAAIFTTDWIHSSYDGTRPDGGEDEATRIRNFVIDYYENHDLRYVLLGGDADGDAGCEECEEPLVPARYLQSQTLYASAIPADMYYGCLDGSFDGDGDGVYGEPSDGLDGGDVDLLFEVHVGRAPIDSVDEASNFVRKTLAYEKSSGPVLRHVLLAAERLDFGGDYDYGGNLSDQIRLGSQEFVDTLGFENSPYKDFFRVSTLYDRNSSWTPGVLVETLEHGVHIVNHVGHADISNVMKLTNNEIDALTNTHYFVGYSQSCYAGAFDNQRTHGAYGSDSVIEHFLAGSAGAVAFVANSRRGWASSGYADGPSQRFNRTFWDVVFRRGTLTLGNANDGSKEELIAYLEFNARARSCAYELNTLGDPLLTLRLAGPLGSVSLDRSFYNPGDSASITVIDSDPNLSPEEIDRTLVRVSASSSGDEEIVELTENGRSSGVFQSAVTLEAGEIAADGKLQVTTPDTISVTYEDLDDGGGQAVTREASAQVVTSLRLGEGCPPSGFFGIPYRARLEAEGGLPPYRFSTTEDYREEIRGPFFQGIGYGQGWSADDSFWAYTLPFPFPFYGRSFEAVIVSANGFLELGAGNARDFANSVEKLIANTRIAPLWADLVTSGGGDIYVREQENSVAFRWFAASYGEGENANAEVEIYSDGRIRFGYGIGNTGLSPTIGISAGDGVNYVISSLSGSENLSRAPAVYFFPTRPPQGLFVDEESGEIAGIPTEVFSGEVSFQVEDALGQVAGKFCRLDIGSDGLEIIAPRAGDLPWLKGSEQDILWEFYGEVGENVRIDYNRTGSESEYPSNIVTSVPVTRRSFEWRLPDVEAPLARIRIQSVEKPHFAVYSDVFSIVGPTLLLRRPSADETWIIGGEGLVGWEKVGDAGANVRIDYNTDGSLDDFPLALTTSTPNTGVLRVAVPETPSETCRLRIESLTVPSATAVSEAFPIRRPSITLTSPNGGDCLRAGDRTLISWSAAGNVGNEVLLEYNTDGDTRVFPLPIGGGPVPQTGSFNWTVPYTLSETCHLRIRSISQPTIDDVSDGLFTIGNRCAIRGLIWVPHVPQGAEQVVGVLQAVNVHEPDFEPFFSTVTTPEALRGELAGKDAMIMPQQKRGFEVDFDDMGRRLAPVLREFLARGGSLTVCQQLSRSEPFLRATGLLDFTQLGVGTRLCEVIDPLHPLLRGIRPNFAGPVSTSWYEIPGGGVDRLVQAAPGHTVVASRDVGFGRLNFLGYDYYAYNDETARILANAVRVVLPEDGIRLTSPNQGEPFQTGQEVPIRWFALGEARGPVTLSYNTTGSATEFPLVIGEVETEESGEGSFSWQAPPPAGDDLFLELHLKVQSVENPEYADVSQEPFYVIRPLVIETTQLPEANVGLHYEAEIRVGGGVPPYEIAVSNLPTGLVAEPSGDASVRIHGLPQQECVACEVEVFVEDSIGRSALRYLPLPVVRRQIRILAPNGGELLLFGSTYRIRWTTSGLVGETVTLRYNLTGSLIEFPDLIAESAPIEENFVWMVPAITAARCRLKIQSEQFPEIFAVSRGTFEISGPSIRLNVPNGGECWQPGRSKHILWQSAGNEIGTVLIEYNTSGSLEEFPHIAASNVPNSGAYVWEVPDTLSSECRLRVSFENAPEIVDVSDETFSIDPECGLTLTLWDPCPGAEANRDIILQSLNAGVTDVDTIVSDTRSPLELEEQIFNRDAVVVPLISICQTLDYENLGSSMAALLTAYARDGGVVVLCGPNTTSSRLLAGLGILERLRVTASAGGLPCEVSSYLHPVVRGVPLAFEGPFSTSSYEFVGSDLETLVQSRGDAVASAQDEGTGRWVILGFNFQVPHPVSSQLLVNSVHMEAVEDGLRILSPRPGQVFAAGDPLSIAWAARGDRSGLVRLRYRDEASGHDFRIAEVESQNDGGSYPWTAPQPPPGGHLTLSLEVSWVDEPGDSAASEAPFFVTERTLAIETVEIPAGRMDAEYSAEIRVSGGVPPYAFDPDVLPPGLFLTAPEGDSPAASITGVPLETVTDFPFHVNVTDALGSTTAADYVMKILPSRLILLTPKGGEHLLAASSFDVEWEVRGYVGETVKVEYNLTGSANVFDHVAAEAAAVHEPFHWTLPDTVSEHCRLRISSISQNQHRHESTSPQSFAIAAPGITCFFPNGLETLETDTTRTIRWRSLGNLGGRVRIELILEGTSDDRSVIAEDVPDTGSYSWKVPGLPWEACRIRIYSVGDPLLVDESDDLFVIRYYTPVRGLIWIPYADHEQLEVRGAIAAVTLTEHDFDWYLSQTRDPQVLRNELRNKEAFVMVQQERRPEVSFEARGREMGRVLEEFALRGGTVVILKQRANAREFLPASGLLHSTEVDGAFDVQCQVALPDHPIANQVPPVFRSAAATSWYEIADEEVDVYVTYQSQPVVAGKDMGDGRVVLIGFDYRNYTTASARILANAVRMAPFVLRKRFVRGDANASGRVDIVDAVSILEYLFRGGREPPCLDAADADDSATLGSSISAVNVNDVIVLLGWLFLGERPLPPPTPVLPTDVYESCGVEDRERDGLGCESFPPCE